MNKPCGCTTAAQCFTKCCCNTPAETLAWARGRDVEPELLAALERRAGVAVTASLAAAADRGCCTVAAKPRPADLPTSCCDTRRDAGTAGSGDRILATGQAVVATRFPPPAEPTPPQGPLSDDERAEDERAEDERAEDERAEQGPVGLSLRAMLACGGVVAEWLVAGAALPPPPPELSARLVVDGRRECGDRTAACVRGAPEAPPPRGA
jgi:hypothetical protein